MGTQQRNNVQVLGHGPQTLLFVNGYGCDQSIWRYILPAFLETHTLVLFDQMGAGNSDKSAYEPEKYASLEGYAQDVLDICQELNLQQVTLIGHSVGATIAVLAANRQPERFRQLLLLCASPCYVNEPGYHGGFERLDLENMLDFLERDYTGWAETFAPFIMGAPEQPTLATELAYNFCQNDQVIAKQFARITFMADNRADISQLKVPCLLVQCSEDIIAPPEVGDYLQRMIPTSTLVTLAAHGHCPHVSAPAETLDAMTAFLVA